MDVEFPGLGLEFHLERIAFSIGSFEVAWYAILIMLGFVLAALYALKSIRRFDLNKDKFMDVIILGLFLGIIGARVYYVIFHLESYQTFFDVINIRAGGLAIYGGVIGAILAGFIGSRWRKLNFFAMLDVTCVGFFIGQCLGRWGNFMNQEAFGAYTTLPWGMLSENTLKVVPEGAVHPCFLYESLWCLIGFIGLHIISKKYYKFRGQLFLTYLMWYGLGRAWIEELRTDSLWLIQDVIKVSWLLAVLSIIVAPVFLYLGFKGKLFDRVGEDFKTVKLHAGAEGSTDADNKDNTEEQ